MRVVVAVRERLWRAREWTSRVGGGDSWQWDIRQAWNGVQFLPYYKNPFWDLLLVCRVVDSGAVIHDVFCCLFSYSVFSTDGVYCVPYFVQPVLEFRVVATSQTTHHRLLFP